MGVYNELKGMSGFDEVEDSSWIKTESIKNEILLKSLMKDIHRGESEAIVLATEKKADFILLDDTIARFTAHKMGFSVIGIIGILIQAKEKKLIAEIKSHLLNLRNAGFWISNSLFQEALTLSEE